MADGAKQIVELHGGHLSVTSEVGIGSCFTVHLPLTQYQAITSIPDPQSSNRANLLPEDLTPKAVAAPQILLVAANDANSLTVSNYLEAKGYPISVIHDCEKAILKATLDTPDLILIDIPLPQMEELKAIEQIRKIQKLRTIPIIALTSFTSLQNQERCLAAGATALISTPVKYKQLVSIIQKLLGSVY